MFRKVNYDRIRENKNLIKDMLDGIDDRKLLKRIYTFVKYII